jgi:osmotically-inducible protein OsmY
VVTLSGFVDSYYEKLEAEQVAKRIIRVKAVANDLDVNLPPGKERSDTEIARAAVQSLQALDLVPHEQIQVTVRDGWLTLEGRVDWNYQKSAADAAVRYLAGVKSASNQIVVAPPVTMTAVKEKIEAALRRSAELEAHRITVETSGSTVILHGAVTTWAQREEAEAASWRAAGVTKVENYLQVLPAFSVFDQPDILPERSPAMAGPGQSWGKDHSPPERP